MNKLQGALAGLDRVRRVGGQAPPEVAPHVLAGAVFVVDDAVIQLPESRLPGGMARRTHETRRVVILSPSLWCQDGTLTVVQVAPCSGHPPATPAHPLDLQLATADEPGFTLAARIYVSLAQPILKSDLREPPLGTVREETLAALLARWARLQRGGP